MDATKNPSLPSRVEPFCFEGKALFLKRDDLIDPCLSGNKFRKLYRLYNTPSDRYEKVISYGGAQSNAMLAIACLAHRKGWQFDYFVKKLPTWLRQCPIGNLAKALGLGMQLHELPHADFDDTISQIAYSCPSSCYFIPQGGADMMAKEGVAILAQEIEQWRKARGFSKLYVATPSGTGTTAWFLRKYLPLDIEVVTTPVVGDADTLKAQWRQIGGLGLGKTPTIMDRTGKWPFAKPNAQFLKIWEKLCQSDVIFDLIYAPKMWLELLLSYERLDGEILYVHSGGVDGNETQLARYRYKKL